MRQNDVKLLQYLEFHGHFMVSDGGISLREIVVTKMAIR